MTRESNKSKQQFEALVDANLKRIYSDLVQEDLPDRFTDLLSRLKEQDSSEGSSK